MTSKGVVALLGDSIIDNKVYVGKNELSVTEHLEANSDFNFEMIAVDGDTTKEVIDNQLEKIRANTSHIVLSIGGNDLLQKLYIMTNQTSGMVQALEIASKTVEEINDKKAKGLALVPNEKEKPKIKKKEKKKIDLKNIFKKKEN